MGREKVCSLTDMTEWLGDEHQATLFLHMRKKGVLSTLCSRSQNKMVSSYSGLTHFPFTANPQKHALKLCQPKPCTWKWQYTTALSGCCSGSPSSLPSTAVYSLEQPQHCAWTAATCAPSGPCSVVWELSLGRIHHQPALSAHEWLSALSTTDDTKAGPFFYYLFTALHMLRVSCLLISVLAVCPNPSI